MARSATLRDGTMTDIGDEAGWTFKTGLAMIGPKALVGGR